MQRTANPCTSVRFRPQPPYKSMKKIAIIGVGFVGNALYSCIEHKSNTYLVDPKLNTEVQDLKKFNPDLVFVCAPTPMMSDGSQDISIIMKIFNELDSLKLSSVTVLKSTMLPSHLQNLLKQSGDFVYNPEFLREKHAEKDMIESEFIILGGSKKNTLEVESFYRNDTKCEAKDFIYTDIVSASLIKYTINSFLATKVTFFNEIYDIFNESHSEETWDNFIKFISADKRIGDSHMQVPGHDGRRGFGGACFPKDMAALERFGNDLNQSTKLIKKVLEINNQTRSQYSKISSRESDQNIFFSDDGE